MSLPPPRTVEQPQACSISRSLMAVSVATAGAWPLSCRCQAFSTRVLEAETSTRLESASASHRRGTAASLLNQSEFDGGFHCTCMCLVHHQSELDCGAVAKANHVHVLEQRGSSSEHSVHSSNECQRQRRALALKKSASASHRRGTAARLLHQSEL